MANKLVAAPQTDPTAEAEGVWDVYTNAEGNEFRVKLARAGTNNPDFLKLSNDVMKPYQRIGKVSTDLPYPIQRQMSRKLYAGSVVKDWNEDDFGVPFSIPECVKTMELANDFLDWVVERSQNASRYMKSVTEDASGN